MAIKLISNSNELKTAQKIINQMLMSNCQVIIFFGIIIFKKIMLYTFFLNNNVNVNYL